MMRLVLEWGSGAFLLAAFGLLWLAFLTPWRRPGGLPHREHVGLCAAGLLSLGMIARDMRTANWSTPVAFVLLAGVLLVIGYRSYRAGRAAEAEASA